MRKHRILLLAGAAAAMLASLAVGPTATAGPDRATAGTVVFIHDQEPPNLRAGWVDNNLFATSLVLNNIWLGGQIRDVDAEWQTKLFTGAPKLLKTKPLTVSFQYSPKAVWSDGTPVTCNDWKANWQVYVNPTNNVASRSGYEDIRSVTCAGKRGTIVFKKVFADWQTLVNSGVLQAKQIAANPDMNRAFEDSIPVSDGPWKFQSWQKGTQITVVRNPRFTIQPMKLDKVVFRYIVDTNARFQALRAGEGQVMEPQPQLQIADFQRDKKNFVVDSKAGYGFEHLDIQFGPKGAPALKLAYVRQALITGINRPQIASALYSTIAPGLPTLQSLLFKTFEKGYQKNFDYPFSQKNVIKILKGKGCTDGPDAPSAANDRIFSCPGVGRLSFRFGTTTGNQLRALTFEIIQRQLKSVGIELVPRFQPAGLLFGTTLPSSDWDIMMFTWVQTPSSKITAKDLYACGGEENYGNYCNRKVHALLEKTAVTLDEDARIKLLNQADVQIAKDIPSIPMYVRPGFVIRTKSLSGPVWNPTTEGSPWNVGAWKLS